VYSLSLEFPREQPSFPGITLRSFNLRSSFHPQTTFKIRARSILWPIFWYSIFRARFYVLIAVLLRTQVVWGVTSCRLAVTGVSGERSATPSGANSLIVWPWAIGDTVPNKSQRPSRPEPAPSDKVTVNSKHPGSLWRTCECVTTVICKGF